MNEKGQAPPNIMGGGGGSAASAILLLTGLFLTIGAIQTIILISIYVLFEIELKRKETGVRTNFVENVKFALEYYSIASIGIILVGVATYYLLIILKTVTKTRLTPESLWIIPVALFLILIIATILKIIKSKKKLIEVQTAVEIAISNAIVSGIFIALIVGLTKLYDPHYQIGIIISALFFVAFIAGSSIYWVVRRLLKTKK